MRILFLTQWFDPEPHFKGLIFAKELQQRGHEVEVLTGFPNYPGGKIYDGYKVKPYQREVMDGITVHRVPLYPSHDKNAVRRVANYTSFGLAAAALGPFVVKKPDVIYAYHAPATIGIPAAILKARFGVPLVYDINDMWPDTLAATGMLTNQFALAAVGVYCRAIYHISDHIVVVTPGFRKLLMERGVPGEKVTVVYNWSHETGELPKYEAANAKRLGFAGKLNVLFAGTMGTAQALDAVLGASKLLAERKPEVQFAFVGGGVDRERLEKRVEDEKLPNVLFLPRQEPSAMGSIYASADVLLVHLKDDPLFRITIPSKTTAYMAAGKPILMGVRGDAATMVEEAGCGLAFPPQDSDALAVAILQLVEMPPKKREELGQRARKFYDEKISLSAGCTAFEQVFDEAMKEQSRGCHRDAYKAVKRAIDKVAAAKLLIAASPILGFSAAAIRATMGSPVLFRQQRPGKDGKPFELLKFRTMRVPKPGEDTVSTDAERLTTLGKFLRATSIDELPTLFNVLKGDMSLVGPRPLLMQYLDRYTPEQVRRHEVKPGITGWAQVNGRNALSWEEKLEHDVWYVDNQSHVLDLKILAMTVLKVLKRDGISADGEATMPEFMGNEAEKGMAKA